MQTLTNLIDENKMCTNITSKKKWWSRVYSNMMNVDCAVELKVDKF